MQPTTTARPSTFPTTAAFGNGHETNLSYAMAELHRERYLALYILLQKLNAAHMEGIQAVTLTTASGSLTVPLYGARAEQFAGTCWMELSEVLGVHLSAHETSIAYHERESQKEEVNEREGEGGRAEAFSFCLPMRPMSDAEFAAMPPQARRAYDEHRAEQLEAA